MNPFREGLQTPETESLSLGVAPPPPRAPGGTLWPTYLQPSPQIFDHLIMSQSVSAIFSPLKEEKVSAPLTKMFTPQFLFTPDQ